MFFNNKEYIYLVWQDDINRDFYVVGQLSKNGQYEFEYMGEIDKALENGFQYLISFPERKKYKSDILFPAFSSRLPDRKRENIDEILKKYNMSEYDPYLLLKNSGAKLPIDNLQFIDPIIKIGKEKIERKFYVSGIRYKNKCVGKFCEQLEDIKVGEQLELKPEENNPKDVYAIKIIYKNREIGYIPRYYSKKVSEYIKKSNNYICEIVELNKSNNCNECIKAKLILNYNKE